MSMAESKMPASLTSLIERIEAATEGSRELDADIWLACTPGATRDKWSYVHKATGRECTVDETRDVTDRLICVLIHADRPRRSQRARRTRHRE